MSEIFRVYFAGDLFNHKDLVGNLLLAEAIEKHSAGRFVCVLPQNLEQASGRSIDIRNQDLFEVICADLVLLNFDGNDLDSGTVAEFMFAKALDIPAVVLRTDFRNSGDQNRSGDPWNLMCSGYPRTKVFTLNGMAWYQEAFRASSSTAMVLETLYAKLAVEVIERLESVLQSKLIIASDELRLTELYRWALAYPGSGLEEWLTEEELLQTLVKKRAKGSV